MNSLRPALSIPFIASQRSLLAYASRSSVKATVKLYSTIPGASSPLARKNGQKSDMRVSNGLTSLRVGIAQKDLSRIQREVAALERHDLEQLSHRDIEDIAKALRKELQPSKKKPTSSVSYHDLALFLASRSKPHSLIEYMYRSLRQKATDEVFDLWDKLHAILSEEPSLSTNNPVGIASDGQGSLQPQLTTSFPDSFNLAGVLGCVLMAYAIRDDHIGALRVSMRSDPIIGVDWARLDHSAEKVLKGDDLSRLRGFIGDIMVVRLLNHLPSAFKQFDALFKRGSVELALKMYQGCLRGMTNSPPWISPIDSNGWQSNPHFLATFDEGLWSTIISGFLRAGRADLSRVIWGQMTALGVPKSAIIWNALLNGYGKRGQIDDMMAAWKAMDSAKVPKDIFSYTTVISSLFEDRRPEEAINLFNEMREKSRRSELKTEVDPEQASTLFADDATEGDPLPPLPVNPTGSLTFATNAVIHGLLITARADLAERLFEEMRIGGPQPDITTYNTFLRFHSRKNNFAGFAATLKSLSSNNVQPDVVTFTILLHTFYRAGDPVAFDKVNALMRDAGIAYNEITYSAIIDSVARLGGETNVNHAFNMMEEMKTKGLHPNEVTFTGLLAALHRDRLLSAEYVAGRESEILESMKKAGIRFNRITYNLLIKASMDREDSDAVRKAMTRYEEMKRSGVMANDDTWYILLHGALDRHDYEAGKVMVREMANVGFLPQGALLGLTMRINRA